MRLAEAFIPTPDVREEHHIDIHAPSSEVLDLATRMDLQALPVVHALIWVRGKLMGARDVVATALDHLRENETVFLHPRGVCTECDEARAGGTVAPA